MKKTSKKTQAQNNSPEAVQERLAKKNVKLTKAQQKAKLTKAADAAIKAGPSKAADAAAAVLAAPPTKGKLGELYGCSVISVMRAMGRAGWDYKRILRSMEAASKDKKSGLALVPQERTIRGAIRRGRNPNYAGRVAVLSEKQLKSLDVPAPATK